MSEKENHETEALDQATGFDDAIEGEVISREQTGKTFRRLPLILAGLTLLGAAAGLLFGYRYLDDLRSSLATLDDNLRKAGQEQTQLAQRLLLAQQELERQKQEFSQQRQALEEQHKSLLETRENAKRSEETLYHSLAEIQTRLGGKEAQWRVAEAEYLLRVANHRLTLMRDPATAMAALKAADERLGATGDPGWSPVRDILAREITQLTALPKVDLTGISAELAALSSQVENLPLLDEGVVPLRQGRPETTETLETADVGFDLGRTLDDLWEGFKSMVVIRHHDRPVSAMLPPEQRYFLIENLRLKLEAAKAALPGHNQPLYKNNLDTAAEWTARYFDVSDPTVTGFREQVRELAKRRIAADLPDISASLRALRERRAQLSQENGQ